MMMILDSTVGSLSQLDGIGLLNMCKNRSKKRNMIVYISNE